MELRDQVMTLLCCSFVRSVSYGIDTSSKNGAKRCCEALVGTSHATSHQQQEMMSLHFYLTHCEPKLPREEQIVPRIFWEPYWYLLFPMHKHNVKMNLRILEFPELGCGRRPSLF